MMTRLLPVVFAVICGFLDALAAAAPAEKPDKKPAGPPAAINQQFAEFLKNPSEANFLKVRKLVTSHASYAPYSSDLDDVADLLEQKKYKEAQHMLAGAMPNLLLSPRAHQYAARAASGLGDEAAAKRGAAAAEQCLKGLRSTGDGTEKRPIIVTRSSDAYDVVHSLKKKVSGHRRQIKEEKSYEILLCSGDTEMWFDVTAALGTKMKTLNFRPPKLPPKKAAPDPSPKNK